MRRLMALSAGLIIVLLSTGAFAQADESEEKSELVEFEYMVVEGEIQVPEGMKSTGRDGAEFDRLLDLKKEKDLMFKVHETTDSDALK